MKIAKDIEKLLTWAYLGELPKRKISSAEGIWDGIEAYGQRGGIDVGQGAAQRYPHFGLPHKDAIEIEKAVNALPNAVIDWDQHYKAIAAELAPLVSINDVPRADGGWRSTAIGGSGYALPGRMKKRIGDTDATAQFVATGSAIAGKLERFSRLRNGKLYRGIRGRPADKPRDVILVNSIDAEQLVFSHAIKGTRPAGWRATDMRAVPTVAARGAHTKIIGVCKGKNSYTSGSYCPLQWMPSPLKIILARANYFAWHQALVTLAQALNLSEHIALPPAAPAYPWIGQEKPSRVIAHDTENKQALLLAPRRKAAGAPPKKPRHSKVRVLEVDKGAKL